MRLLLFAFLVGMVYANNIADAMRSGTKEGDIHMIFDYTSSNPDYINTKYQDNSYLATSFGLYYSSAFYGYLRAHIGFRGAVHLYEDSRKSQYPGGRGDASRDFWDNNKAMLARSYLEYFDGDTSVKAGRLEDSTDLISNHFDGIWIKNKSLGILLIEFVWLNQQGIVLPRELSGFQSINSEHGGGYYLGGTFDILSFLKLKLYGFTSPHLYSYLGFKAGIDTTYVTLNADVVTGLEHRNSQYKDKTSLLFNTDFGLKFNIVYAKVGYIRTGSSVGMGNLQLTGNSFSPFFYFGGDALNYQRNVNLVYGKLGVDSDIIKTYVTYGYNRFNRLDLAVRDSNKYSQGEVNFYFDWQTTDATNVIFYFLNTHGAKNVIPNTNQLGLALKLGF